MRTHYQKEKNWPEPDPIEGAAWIPLSKGTFALVDASDYEELSKFNWHMNHYGYAVRMIRKVNGSQTAVFMHREIVKPRAGFEVDHINWNRSDNRKCNLRECTRSENQKNRKDYSLRRRAG